MAFVIVITSVIAGIVIYDEFENRPPGNFEYPPPCTACDEIQLQKILDYCANVELGKDRMVPGDVWNNGTHYMNSWDCEMEQMIILDSSSDEELTKVLQYCEAQQNGEWKSGIELSWNNSTHHIDNTDCEFFPNDEIYEQEISIQEAKVNYYDYRLDDDFETNYTDDFNGENVLDTLGPYMKEFCSIEIISYLTENSNIFNQTAYNFEWINAPDNISENEFSSCIHEIEEILYPRGDEPTPMDDNTETDFTEKCHFIPTTIHANFTDGKVITTTDDC